MTADNLAHNLLVEELLGGAQRKRTRVRGFAPWTPKDDTLAVLRHVQAVLEEYADHITLKLRDNGRGISEDALRSLKSIGLLSMRERARQLSGTVRIEGSPQQGTTVTIDLPLHHAPKATASA